MYIKLKLKLIGRTFVTICKKSVVFVPCSTNLNIYVWLDIGSLILESGSALIPFLYFVLVSEQIEDPISHKHVLANCTSS